MVAYRVARLCATYSRKFLLTFIDSTFAVKPGRDQKRDSTRSWDVRLTLAIFYSNVSRQPPPFCWYIQERQKRSWHPLWLRSGCLQLAQIFVWPLCKLGLAGGRSYAFPSSRLRSEQRALFLIFMVKSIRCCISVEICLFSTQHKLYCKCLLPSSASVEQDCAVKQLASKSNEFTRSACARFLLLCCLYFSLGGQNVGTFSVAQPTRNFGGRIFRIYTSNSIWFGTPRPEAQSDKIC